MSATATGLLHLRARCSVRAGDGALMGAYDDDPYGRLISVSGLYPGEFGYAGMHHHVSSGLWLTRYRAYDSQTARWLSRDPIEEEGGVNLYGYVNGNPISYKDPMGLEKTVDDMLGPDHKDSPPPPDYPTTDRRPVPPPLPPPPSTPNPDPWPGPNDWRGQCIRLYTQCVNQGWTGNCGACLNKCTAQEEWPFSGPGSCRPRRNQCPAS